LKVNKFGIDFIQLVWWGRFPKIKWWAYPQSFKDYEAMMGKPIFWGLYLGLFEIRFFPVRGVERIG